MKHYTLFCGSILAIAVLVLVIFISWFNILHKCPKFEEHTGTTTIVVIDSICKDSLTITNIDSIYKGLKRLDEIESRLDKLSNSYLTEVDLAVDKSNGWLAFWIGVITIVIGLSSFWQVYRQYQGDKEFRKLKIDSERTLDRQVRDANKNIDKQKEKIDEIEKKIVDNLNNLKKNFRETKISSLMMCLSSFPDPQMTANTEDKKKQIYKLMKNILAIYVKYIENVELQEKNGQVDFDAVFMVLTNLKLAIVRTHGAYSDIHQNIRFSHIIRRITEVNNAILNGEPICNLSNQLNEIAFSLHGLVDIIEK